MHLGLCLFSDERRSARMAFAIFSMARKHRAAPSLQVYISCSSRLCSEMSTFQLNFTSTASPRNSSLTAQISLTFDQVSDCFDQTLERLCEKTHVFSPILHCDFNFFQKKTAAILPHHGHGIGPDSVDISTRFSTKLA